MRAITVRQPWAWAIVHGGKDVENRSRNIAGAYRGPVAIHAGQADADGAPDSLWHKHASHYRSTHPLRDPDDICSERGAIVGVVDLVDVHDELDTERNDGDLCSPWAMRYHHHLVLANPRPLATPIRATGRLGLWTLPDDIAAQVADRLGAK